MRTTPELAVRVAQQLSYFNRKIKILKSSYKNKSTMFLLKSQYRKSIMKLNIADVYAI